MQDLRTIRVIIPAYNAAAFLAQTVASVLAAHDVIVRVVIVDDGSQDATAEVARQLQAKHKNVSLISQKNGGVSTARNAGIDKADHYVCFLDADDLLAPDGLRQLMFALEANDDAVAAYGRVGYMSGTVKRTPPLNLKMRQTGDISSSVLCGNLIDTPGAILFRTEAILQVGGFIPGVRIGEDWNLYARVAQLGPVLFVDEIVMWYRIHEGSVMSRGRLSLADFKLALDSTYSCALIRSKHSISVLKKSRLEREIGLSSYIIQRSQSLYHIMSTVKDLVLTDGFFSNGGFNNKRFWRMMGSALKAAWRFL